MRPVLIVTLAWMVSAALAGAETTPAAAPEDALARLMEGNRRFAEGRPQPRPDTFERVKETARDGQRPFAVILSCSDSRVPPETVFDQGVGDLFVVRAAGHVAGGPQTGSVEYGVGHLGARLVAVVGHSRCGAASAAASGEVGDGNVPAFVCPLLPAVARAKARLASDGDGTRTGDGEAALVEACVRENVFLQMEALWADSPALRQAARDGRAAVVGLLYDLETGAVARLGPHPREAELTREPIPSPVRRRGFFRRRAE